MLFRSTTITTGCKNSLVCSHSVDSTIGHVVSHHTSAFAIIHDKVKSKVFNEEDAVISESSSEKGMKHRVTCSVSDSAASISLTTSTEVSRLTSEGSLINFTILGSAKRHTI